MRRSLAFALLLAPVLGCGTILGIGGDYFEVTDAGAQGDATNDRTVGTADGGDNDDGGDRPRRDSGPDTGGDSGADSARDAVAEASTGIRCGATVCKADAGLECCAVGFTCVPAGTCDGGVIACDDRADCVAQGLGGLKCCGRSSGARCETSSSCDDGGDELCDPAVPTGCQCTRTKQIFGVTFSRCD